MSPLHQLLWTKPISCPAFHTVSALLRSLVCRNHSLKANQNMERSKTKSLRHCCICLKCCARLDIMPIFLFLTTLLEVMSACASRWQEFTQILTSQNFLLIPRPLPPSARPYTSTSASPTGCTPSGSPNLCSPPASQNRSATECWPQ